HELATRLIARGFNSMFLWALEKNTACRFYERLGGKKSASRIVKFGSADLVEIAYGWNNLHALAESTAEKQNPV
ncbi:MAG TPA: GNAT family N-acetyltransferase, partial [Phycisphaerae bacterium]|nr:GNAT family N-acetyltransferase [Phycisphaerae bacterium]